MIGKTLSVLSISMSEKLYYTWVEFDSDVRYLTSILTPEVKKNKWTGIYAIPRGGLVLGVCLSHELGLPLYTNSLLALQDRRIIVVDEIADTGSTLRAFRVNTNPIVTLWKKIDCPLTPDFYVRENTNWVIMPWENRS